MTAERRNPITEEMLARLPMSADIYPQKLDFVRETALLIRFGEEAYRSASFLDDRVLGPKTNGALVSLERVVAASRAAANLRPAHFIFHTGHVGSTLVSRLLEDSGGVLSLREPLPLRLLASAHDDLGKPYALLGNEQFEQVLDAFLRLWSRGYDRTRCVVVKATSSSGRLAAPLLTRCGGARAIYLNLRAEPYLATLLAGQNSRDDLRGHGPERMRRLLAFGVEAAPSLHQLSLGQLAAMSWLTETLTQRETLKKFGERVLDVDFDRFLANVPDGMSQIMKQFELAEDAKFLSSIAASPTLTRYAKAPEHAYTPEFRSQILADSRQRHGHEIREGLRWLENTARSSAAATEILNGAGG
ncbi:MAG: hypothetical protein K8S25_07260 [Alphaproteobacteria bacterium]|nr:hypothetical protein [Alphaproteobacteria bacterium]